MKRMVCEMCESTDFVKEDGKFVCQGCGLQYSLEEAKKLMVEVDGQPETKTEAAADNGSESQKVANLRKLAQRAKEDSDSEMAAKYYEQLMMECPDDWEARFYSTYYAAHNIKIAQIGSAANKVTNIIGSTFQMIRDSVDESQWALTYLPVCTDVLSFSTMLFNNITPNLGSTAETVNRNIDNWAVPTVTMLVILGDELRDKFASHAADVLAKNFYNSAQNYTKSMKDRTNAAARLHINILSRINQVTADIQEYEDREKAEKQRIANEEYWAQHAEEKVALENEKADLDIKYSDIDATIKAIETKNDPVIKKLQAEKAKTLPVEVSLKAQQELVTSLNNQRASLGIFKGKEKKAIDARLNEVEAPKLAQLHAAAQQERSALNANIDKQIADLQNESGELVAKRKEYEDRIAAITKELTMDR